MGEHAQNGVFEFIYIVSLLPNPCQSVYMLSVALNWLCKETFCVQSQLGFISVRANGLLLC